MTDNSAVEASVVKQIAVEMGVEEAQVRRAGSLRGDVGMDSVAAANILFALEELFEVELDLDEVISVDSVADVVALLLAAERSG